METLQDLFEDSIKDVYSAEKQFLKAMPKMMKAARSPELKSAIETHIAQSQVQAERLEEIAKGLGIKPSGKVCKAAQGLVEEGTEHLEEGDPGPVLDAAIVACLQKNEHYEITTYGSILAWAQELGNADAAKLLKATLGEEEKTDELLTGIAQGGVNSAAKSAQAPEPAAKKALARKPAAKSTAAKSTASKSSK